MRFNFRTQTFQLLPKTITRCPVPTNSPVEFRAAERLFGLKLMRSKIRIPEACVPARLRQTSLGLAGKIECVRSRVRSETYSIFSKTG